MANRSPDATQKPAFDANARALGAGAIIEGRYTVLEQLGTGGMGEVYAAYDAKLDRKVALKVLRHRSAQYEARLEREAQAMARLSHPNVVGVFDKGLVGDRLYLAMEFVRGVTLRVWQSNAPRDLREIVRVYTEAGHGLAAAHAAGLVHRDFKPDNVLIAEDGRVKVTDFGIARAVREHTPEDASRSVSTPRLGDADPAPATSAAPSDLPSSSTPQAVPASPSSGRLESALTEDGALLGTPGYMAPEQFLGLPVDERSDQFAFCVSLYQAIYGKKPYLSEHGEADKPGLAAVAQSMMLEKLPEPPKGAKVAPHVRRTLLRGLRADANARYPSMRALLQDLGHDPSVRRRRIALGLSATAALVAMLAVGTRAVVAGHAQVCAGTEAEVAAVWNPDVVARTERALLATGVPYAKDTWSRAHAELDGYMRRWAEMHKETCESTRVHGHQSENVMALRNACLEERRSEVRALLDVLATADANVVSAAHPAAMSLAGLDPCKNVAALTALMPEPTDAAKRAELVELRAGIAAVHAKLDAGRDASARDDAAALIPRAKRLGYAPATAELLLYSARAKERSSTPLEGSVRDMLDAAAEADAGHADALRAEAATQVSLWWNDAGNPSEAERWLRVADGALRRIDERGAQRALWKHASSLMQKTRGNLADAATLGREAVDLGRSAQVSPPLLLRFQMGLADREAALGHAAGAAHAVAEADDLVVRTMGAEHPRRIDVQLDACTSSTRASAFEAALPHCEKAVELAEAVDARDGRYAAYGHDGVGHALLGLGRWAEALTHFERALAIREKLGSVEGAATIDVFVGIGLAKLSLEDPRGAKSSFERAISLAPTTNGTGRESQASVARARFGLARAEWAAGARGATALDPARAALEAYRGLGEGPETKEVADWLAAHER